PDFIEVKGYMFVGASRQRLSLKNMPFHEDVVAFTDDLAKYLPGYEVVTDHAPSRVVMLAKKEFRKDGKWYTWIDFKKFKELALKGDDFGAMDYVARTPRASFAKDNVPDKENPELEDDVVKVGGL
ncbi:MAG: hypothetical protein ABIH41_00535, partial [Nanoarchaeota archaeon]